MANRAVTIKDKAGTVLAQGSEPEQLLYFEGNWYFDPAQVNMAVLKVTERTYTCPYKGVCFWVDLQDGATTARDIGWVYDKPKAGYEQIAGRIAFYNGNRDSTVAEVN